MQVVPPTWETESHMSSSRLRREQRHTWSQRCVGRVDVSSVSLLVETFSFDNDPHTTFPFRTPSTCWRTTFPLTHNTTWSSSCPNLCWEYLSPSWERAKQRASCSVSQHTWPSILTCMENTSLKKLTEIKIRTRLSKNSYCEHNRKRCDVLLWSLSLLFGGVFQRATTHAVKLC